MDKRVRWVSLVIFGLMITTGFYLRYESWLGTRVWRPLQQDALDYFSYAYNLRHHHTYSKEYVQPSDSNYRLLPDAVRSPGYPLFLALLIDGPPTRMLIRKIQFWQLVVSTITLVAAFFFLRCYLPPLGVSLAIMLTVFSPHLIMFNSYVLTETLFCFFLVLTGLMACSYIKNPCLVTSALMGAVMGAAALIRPSLQYFPLVMALYILFYHRRKKGLKLVFAMLLGFILVISPWLIRNLVTLSKISDNSLMINFLHHGMYPDFQYQGISESHRRPYRFDPRSKEIGKNVVSVMQEITRRFRNQPMTHLKWYLLKKPLAFWSWDMIQGHGDVFVYYVSKTPFRAENFFAGRTK